MLQTLSVNNSGRIRRDTLNGRDYLVAPVRMIVPGVMAGSRGASLYTLSEIQKSVFSWNGMPIVVNHPAREGKYISAREPDIIRTAGVGMVYNASIESGNLDAEAWIDIERLREVHPALAAQAERGEAIEISTGLGTDNRPRKGTYRGKLYDFVSENLAPDHLALLPDQPGACSLSDGCGLSVNEMKDWVDSYNRSGTSKTFSGWVVTNSSKLESGCGCQNTCAKCKGDFDFQPTVNVAVDFDFQPTVNAEDTGWRTMEGGAKVYIGGDGEVRAGGPKGPVVSGGDGEGSAKKNKTISDIAKKEFHISSLDSKGRDSSDFHEISTSGAQRALTKAFESGGGKVTAASKKQLAAIAKKHLGIRSFKSSGRDSADFHETSSHNLKAALTAAYDAAGKKS